MVGIMLSGSQQKEHVLNRLGYGQSVWHSNRYDAIGRAAYVTEQLDGSLASISATGTTIGNKAPSSTSWPTIRRRPIS